MPDKIARVLLVEDNPGDARLFRELLSESPLEQFSLLTAERLSDVPEMLRAAQFDVIVLDLALPDSQGLDTLGNIRSLTTEVPIVVLTGLNDDELGIEAVSRGAQDYLIKGEVSPSLLARSVRHAIERHRLEAAEREQRRLAQALRDSAAILNSTLNSETVLDLIMESIEQVVPYDGATIVLVDSHERARIVRARGCMSEDEAQGVMALEYSLEDLPVVESITRTSKPRIISDVSLEEGWRPCNQQCSQCSYVGAPIRTEGRVIGVISITSATHNFYREAHESNLQALADQAAMAINNAHHYDAQARYSEQLQQEVARAVDQIRQSKEQIEVILDSAPDPILLLDNEGHIHLANPALHDQFQYPPEETRSFQLTRLVVEEHREQLAQSIRAVVHTRSPQRLEVLARRKDGSTFDADLAVAPVSKDNGVSGIVCSLRDISALKEIERLKDSFLSTAAHELRTPLTSIQGFSELLLTRELSPDRQLRYFKFINEQAEQLASIINDLLDLSRMEAGRDLEISVTGAPDLAQIVEDVVQTFRETTSRHRFVTEGFAALPALEGDSFRLGQVLRNLVSNAVKYSPDGGQVTIRGEVVDDHVRVTVKDEGIGLTAEQQSHVFEKFYRVNNTDTGGTGLGLTICKMIVEGHGGRIGFSSKFNKGSTFYFTLPLPRKDS